MIHFYSLQTPFLLKDKIKLKKFIISQLLQGKNSIKQLDFIFCNNKYLLKMNQQFLQHNYFTDIITFDLSEKKNIIEAEIYISLEMVNYNARQLKIKKTDELLRVIFHGLLHLLGYKDKTEKQKLQMTAMEDKWLLEYNNFII